MRLVLDRIIRILAMLIVLANANVVSAAGIETLLMPGKVTNAHAKLESVCTNCHDRTNRTNQTNLCLDCHKDVAQDMSLHKRFHGKLPNTDTLQCVGCHTEHKGRDADIVKLIPEQFNHDRTDFPLRDAHAGVACGNCHTVGKKYRAADSACVSCHKKDEPHQGRLGNDCAACHGTSTWFDAHYDHGKTRFPLFNKHAELPCVACHAGNRYKNTPLDCVACHAPDDVHRNSRGDKCANCHSTVSWTTSKFDHAKETGFALEGVHAQTDCVSCHTSGRMEDKIPKDCHGCHQGQDAHAGRMGTACDKCHGSAEWKPARFNHDRDTKFLLVGAHAKLQCDTCHTGNIAAQKLATDCVGCHRADDVHVGQLGKQCENCHNSNDWRRDIGFDHDLSSFPLVGLHVAVPCEQCHLTKQFKDAAADCHGCHEADDVHRGGLGKQCDTCHSPNGWRLWKFDHNKQTQFPLTGAHTSLECAECHRGRVDSLKPSMDCISCHQQDDVHAGQFGRQCQRCHSTSTFKGGRAR